MSRSERDGGRFIGCREDDGGDGLREKPARAPAEVPAAVPARSKLSLTQAGRQPKAEPAPPSRPWLVLEPSRCPPSRAARKIADSVFLLPDPLAETAVRFFPTAALPAAASCDRARPDQGSSVRES